MFELCTLYTHIKSFKKIVQRLYLFTAVVDTLIWEMLKPKLRS